MNDQNDTLISVVVPMKNENDNIIRLYLRIRDTFEKLVGYAYELIYVDDGSTDESAKTVQHIRDLDPAVRLIQLSRNFGKEIATTAGLHHSTGKAAVMIDADLQHPPELIASFIEKWHEGFDIVVGKRLDGAHHTSKVKHVTSHVFYKLIRAISRVEIIPNTTDFRLLDRAVIDEFNRFTERNRMTRGLIDWLGFSRAIVEFTPEKRYRGDASYSFISLMKLALNSAISMSFFPLYLAGYLGGVIVILSVPLGLFIFVDRYIFNDPLHLHISGPAQLAVILLFLVGVILICLGLMALYIANIYGEVANRPLYVVKRQTERI
jgi:glycosyltransferase involved in cell wall biosynthesis